MTAFSSNDQECIDRQIPHHDFDVPSTRDINDKYDIDCTCEWIIKNNFQKVCLQFPDELLSDSADVYERIRNKTKRKIYILGDTSYGSCCVDEVAAQHVNADCMVHYGHSCFSPSNIPVKYVVIRLPLNEDQVLHAMDDSFTGDRKIALFFDFPFIHLSENLFNVILKVFPNALLAQINENTTNFKQMNRRFIDYTGKEQNVVDLLQYECIFIGHNAQIMFNLELTIKANKWYFLNASSLQMLPSSKTIWFKRRRYLVELCKDAKNIGILICTLSIKNFLDVVSRMKTIIRNSGRRSYIISVGKPNIEKLANLSEIDIFVLIACPENELYGSSEFYKPLIYPCELEAALMNQEFLVENYRTNFAEILETNADFTIQNKTDVSLITGQVRDFGIKDDDHKITNDNKDLHQVNMAMETMDIGSSMRNKTWQGLEQNLGNTEVKQAEIGRSGTTLGYDNEMNL